MNSKTMTNKTNNTCARCGKHGVHNQLCFCNGVFYFCKSCSLLCCKNLCINPKDLIRENGIFIMDNCNNDMSEILYNIQHKV